MGFFSSYQADAAFETLILQFAILMIFFKLLPNDAIQATGKVEPVLSFPLSVDFTVDALPLFSAPWFCCFARK